MDETTQPLTTVKWESPWKRTVSDWCEFATLKELQKLCLISSCCGCLTWRDKLFTLLCDWLTGSCGLLSQLSKPWRTWCLQPSSIPIYIPHHMTRFSMYHSTQYIQMYVVWFSTLLHDNWSCPRAYPISIACGMESFSFNLLFVRLEMVVCGREPGYEGRERV